MNMKTSNRVIMILYVIVLSLLLIQVGKYYNKFVNKENNDDFVIKYDYEDNSRIVSDMNNNGYSSCLNGLPLYELDNERKEIEEYIKEHDMALYYEDINTSYVIKYNENITYYGASLIKLLDALYLYDNKVNLMTKVSYISDRGDKCSSNKQVDNEITLKDLVYCALSVSDNDAHFMLYNYIGRDNLIRYGNSLGVKNILTSSEKFGNQTVTNTNIYLKRLYEIKDTKYGKFLIDTMTNDFYSSINKKLDVNVAHKYGKWENYYHDVGIVFDDNPYTISIFTKSANDDYTELVGKLSLMIYEYHSKYWLIVNRECGK